MDCNQLQIQKNLSWSLFYCGDDMPEWAKLAYSECQKRIWEAERGAVKKELCSPYEFLEEVYKELGDGSEISMSDYLAVNKRIPLLYRYAFAVKFFAKNEELGRMPHFQNFCTKESCLAFHLPKDPTVFEYEFDVMDRGLSGVTGIYVFADGRIFLKPLVHCGEAFGNVYLQVASNEAVVGEIKKYLEQHLDEIESFPEPAANDIGTYKFLHRRCGERGGTDREASQREHALYHEIYLILDKYNIDRNRDSRYLKERH